MFKIKRKAPILEAHGVEVGMIVELNNEIFEIVAIRAESWGGNTFEYIAKGVKIGDASNDIHNLFLCSNFHTHVINGIVKLLEGGEKVQPSKLSD